ncbi:protease modulator HflC [Marinibaculum pumilum]|uniref:Protease modulator HflC n=1 Tax=Marinibaculum pumilum TaxID=1766165 RepID=A0ABV7LB08_9PROT
MSRALLTIVAIVLVGLGIVASSALFTVYETQQALVFQFGDPKQVIRQPGLHVKVPFVQDVVFIDKRILPLDSQPEEIIASDQRRLVVDAFLRFRVVDPLKLYQTTTTVAGARTRLGPLLNSSLRQVLGREPSNAIVSGERSQVMTEIQQLLNREAERFGIEVVDVRIKRADFPDEVSQTIFRRMQTAREQEAAQIRAQGDELSERIRADADRQRTEILAEARKNAEITRGEGDGIRTKTLADAANQDPEFYAFYRSLQAYETALQSDDTRMVLTPNSEFFRYFQGIPGPIVRPGPGRTDGAAILEQAGDLAAEQTATGGDEAAGPDAASTAPAPAAPAADAASDQQPAAAPAAQ